MSFCDHAGAQLDPDDLAAAAIPLPVTEGTEVSETLDAETGLPVVVVRFGDAITVTTAADMCATMGVDLAQFREAMAGLIAAGWLSLLEDGTYGATIPEADK
jgi:hypothetical protein